MAWRTAAQVCEASDVDSELAARLDALGSLGGYKAAPSKTGVVRHVDGLAGEGMNLYISGHDSAANLMTMEGEVVHSWRIDFNSLCPDDYSPDDEHLKFFRRARLLDNGELLAIFDYAGLVKLDKDSNPIWFKCQPYHHDATISSDGTIIALMRQERTADDVYGETAILDDEVHMLSPAGKLLRRMSMLDMFANSEYAPALNRVDRNDLEWKLEGDLFHSNSVKRLDGTGSDRSAAFSEGNLLVTLRNMDLIVIVDPEQEKVVWTLSGMWHKQHEAVLLATGNLMLFDNWGLEGRSRVIEFDPFSQKIAWFYIGSPNDPFFSSCCGSNQRLPNGNTLITDTTNGRAFEVTPDKQIAWDFWNPHRTGKDEELIASLFDLMRVPSDQSLDWLD